MKQFILLIEKKIKRNYYLKWIAAHFLSLVCKFSPAFDANRLYRRRFGRKINLSEPGNLIEKIVWLELYSDTSQWTRCEDKYLMREYAEEKGYGSYLPKLYGVWEKAESIDFSLLPRSFVIKTNHGCGDVIVVHDKQTLNEKQVKRVLRRALSIPYGYNNAALHYTRITPRILAEELLHNDFENISKSMVDFKLWCINGKIQSILIVYCRNAETGLYALDLYDPFWNRIDYCLTKSDRFIFHEESPFSTKPDCLNEMIDVAEELASNLPQVRVDFYIVNGRPILGEMSFYTGYGYFTKEYCKQLGRDISIPPAGSNKSTCTFPDA